MSNNSTVDYYVAPRKSFEATADAIRAVNGSTASLVWGQNGFADEVGSERKYTLDEMCEYGNSSPVSGEITLAGTYIRPFMFTNNKNITSIIGNNVTSLKADPLISVATVYTFCNCSSLINITLPLVTDFDRTDYLFDNCLSLQTVNLNYKNITKLGTHFLANCPAITKTAYVMPKLISNLWSQTLTSNPNVTVFDIESSGTTATAAIREQALWYNSNLTTIIIRGARVRTLTNINAFTATPFASDGAGGVLYVPNNLISSYQSATNWSTILSYTNNSIQKIEGSYYETHYADGTEIGGTS